jgi:hypothetical protein
MVWIVATISALLKPKAAAERSAVVVTASLPVLLKAALKAPRSQVGFRFFCHFKEYTPLWCIFKPIKVLRHFVQFWPFRAARKPA